nr:MAG TPA: hypothetical protein [Caudoviricetes sp.]
MTDTTTNYATVHANMATHQLLAGEPAPITSGIVTFTPTSMSHDDTTVYTACEVKGYLVNGILRTHANGGARGVQLIAPARYNVQVSARTGTARQIIIDCIPLTVQPGQEINLAAAAGDSINEVPNQNPQHQPATPSREWVAEDLGNGLARIVEKEKN